MRDRIDAALFVRRRAQRLAVVEEGAPIPVSVPRFLFQRGRQRRGVRAPHRRSVAFPARLGDGNESRQRRVKEPAEPNAFARALFADAVHAVVPVARPDQGEPMDAERQRGVESQRAMLEYGRGLVRDGRIEEAVMFAGLDRLALQERNALVEDSKSPVVST